MKDHEVAHGAPIKSSVGHALDDLSWQRIHTRIAVVLGLGWMLDAFEVNIVGGVLGVLQKLWNVSTTQAALLVSSWLLGIMIGAVLFGYCADRFGRRKLFILTLLIYSGFTVLSALSPGYYAFLVFRLLTAIGVGAEYSAVNAAIVELVPARYRGRAAATVMNFWPIGSILAGVVTLYFINVLPPSIGWRLAARSISRRRPATTGFLQFCRWWSCRISIFRIGPCRGSL